MYQVRMFQMTSRPQILSEHRYWVCAWCSAMVHAACTPLAVIDIKKETSRATQ